MIPHLPRPVRTHMVAVARSVRRTRKGAEAMEEVKVKRPQRPSRAFDALYDMTPPMVLAIAAPDSD
jgi:hypothetical protein